MSLDITQNDLEDVASKIKRATQHAHELTAAEVWGNIREFAPQDHGRLAGSFALESRGIESRITSNVVYAAVHEEGRGPYEIYPKTGRYMTFQINGDWISVESISHPGIPATHYISRSIEAAGNRVSDFVHTALAAEGLA